MKKKFLPLILLFIMTFSGVLSTQIILDKINLNAESGDPEKQKHALYETNFQALKLTTTKKTTIELKNEKTPIIVLNFWASWCVPCLKEFPSLVEFQNKFKDQVKVIGINGDTENTGELIAKTEKKYNLNFESVEDPYEKISESFLIRTYPVSIVYHKGKVLYVNKKMHNFMDSDFVSMVEKALKAN